MSIEDLIKYISNTGLAVVLVAWGIWRFDKFLSKLCHHIAIINDEIGDLSKALKEVVEHIKLKPNEPK